MSEKEFVQSIFHKEFDGESLSDNIMNYCGEYIKEHPEHFISTAYEAFKLESRELQYDYAEIKAMEHPELLEVNYGDGVYNVKAGVPYILDLWKEPDFLGHSNCYAEAIISFELNHSLEPSDFKLIKVQNVEEYFDIYTY